MSTTATAAEGVCAFAAAIRFHRSLTFDSATVQKTLRVTYATAGCQDPDTPTILFAGGLYGGRWNALWIDHLCQQKKVRVVIVDRPGFGGSTAVALEHRIPVWLETVPVLLQHVGIDRVTLAAHSCGVLYLFNTLYHLPHILATPNPTVHLISPWVHPSNSGAKMLTIASAMPAGFVTGWNKMTSFLVNRFMPSSAPTSNDTKGKKQDSKGGQKSNRVDGSQVPTDEAMLIETCGLTSGAKQPTRDYFIKMFFLEDTSGVADEAKLGLRTGGGNVSWGVCDDYAAFVPQLAQKLADDGAVSGKVLVAAYFGEKDSYVGKGGIQYFRQLWEKDVVRQSVSAQINEVAGMDHDSLTLPEHRILGRIFDATRESSKAGMPC